MPAVGGAFAAIKQWIARYGHSSRRRGVYRARTVPNAVGPRPVRAGVESTAELLLDRSEHTVIGLQPRCIPFGHVSDVLAVLRSQQAQLPPRLNIGLSVAVGRC